MDGQDSNWYAIRARRDFMAETVLAAECEEVFFPKKRVLTPSGTIRTRAIIPHVLFIKTTRGHALELERKSRKMVDQLVPFWIYRYVKGEDIQIIRREQINLIRLLTANDTTRCEIFNKKDFKRGETVRITGGMYEGYMGVVQRVHKNKHVVVEIQGICMIMLPFIHPDLLAPVDDSMQADI